MNFRYLFYGRHRTKAAFKSNDSFWVGSYVH